MKDQALTCPLNLLQEATMIRFSAVRSVPLFPANQAQWLSALALGGTWLAGCLLLGAEAPVLKIRQDAAVVRHRLREKIQVGLTSTSARLAGPRLGVFEVTESGRLRRLPVTPGTVPASNSPPATPTSEIELLVSRATSSEPAATSGEPSHPAQAIPATEPPMTFSTGPQTPAAPDGAEAQPDGTDAERSEPISGSGPSEAFRGIGELRAQITPPAGPLPEDRASGQFASGGEELHGMGFSREAAETQVHWEAPALSHRPLFFEDVNLERHGYHYGMWQPVVSAAHFFGRVPALPYLSASQQSRVATYTLGHYRPGSPAPYVWYYPRASWAGLTFEGAVAAGIILAIP